MAFMCAVQVLIHHQLLTTLSLLDYIQKLKNKKKMKTKIKTIMDSDNLKTRYESRRDIFRD